MAELLVSVNRGFSAGLVIGMFMVSEVNTTVKTWIHGAKSVSNRTKVHDLHFNESSLWSDGSKQERSHPSTDTQVILCNKCVIDKLW